MISQSRAVVQNGAMRVLPALALLFLPSAAEADPIKGPPLDTGFAISLSAPSLKPSPGIGVYELDLFDAEQPVIDTLHAAGGFVICYFSAGSFEDWRPDVARFPKDVLGKAYEGWPGERWLDIRRREVLAPILEARLDLATRKDCDAVDPDNVDGFSIQTGFAISVNDQRAFNRWLAEAAHARGLAIGLKNAAELVPDLVDVFDFAVVESCAAQKACDDHSAFSKRGKAVFQIEYRGEIEDWSSVCRDAKGLRFTAILANLELDGDVARCPME